MKKSLQYVLIMSALGFQSGVLLAQEKNTPSSANESQSDEKASIAITGADFKVSALAWVQSGSMDDTGMSSGEINTFLSKINPQDNFTYDALKQFPTNHKIFALNVLASTTTGLRYVNEMPSDMKNSILVDIVRTRVLNKTHTIRYYQGIFFLAVSGGQHITSEILKPFEDEYTLSNLTTVINHSDGSKSNSAKGTATKVPMSTLSGNTFMSPYRLPGRVLNTILNIAQSILGQGVNFDIDKILDSKEVSNSDKSLIVANVAASKPGIDRLFNLPLSYKKVIIKLAIDNKTNQNNDAVDASLKLVVLKAYHHNPKAWAITRGDIHFIESSLKNTVKNKNIDINIRLTLLSSIKNNNGTKGKQLYEESKRNFIKSIPENLKEIMKERLKKAEERYDYSEKADRMKGNIKPVKSSPELMGEVKILEEKDASTEMEDRVKSKTMKKTDKI